MKPTVVYLKEEKRKQFPLICATGGEHLTSQCRGEYVIRECWRKASNQAETLISGTKKKL